jgi:protein-S-isoprenylcysteine O-methyltransferase Ste14
MAEGTRVLTPGLIVRLLLFVVLIPLLPLIVSGQWDWLQAWIYALVYILGFAISRALVARRYPDLIAERARFTQHEDAKPWDKTLASLLALFTVVLLVTAGLDARFAWSPALSVAVQALALAVLLVGWALGSWALVANRFFSGVVRIQTDRGHVVVDSGPYRWVRHPGYAGALLTFLATPLFLDSLWAILPAIALGVVLVVRTRLEDATLHAELAGYREYSGRVRYRLVPGVW